MESPRAHSGRRRLARPVAAALAAGLLLALVALRLAWVPGRGAAEASPIGLRPGSGPPTESLDRSSFRVLLAGMSDEAPTAAIFRVPLDLSPSPTSDAPPLPPWSRAMASGLVLSETPGGLR
jgi:hypothetical protein